MRRTSAVEAGNAPGTSTAPILAKDWPNGVDYAAAWPLLPRGRAAVIFPRPLWPCFINNVERRFVRPAKTGEPGRAYDLTDAFFPCLCPQA